MFTWGQAWLAANAPSLGGGFVCRDAARRRDRRRLPADRGADVCPAAAGAAAAANAAPAGVPAITGTAAVGATLSASAADITDDDGLANATFAWQWIANDGTADADIVDATAATYVLTAAEEGKTVRVRVTFTDDAGTEETLESAATAAVAATLPAVSIAAAASPVTEGTAAAFTLGRTGDAAAALDGCGERARGRLGAVGDAGRDGDVRGGEQRRRPSAWRRRTTVRTRRTAG